MNPQTKHRMRQLAFGLFGAGAVGILVLGALNPGNVAYTSPENDDPHLRTRHYAGSVDVVSEAVRAIIPALKTYGRSWRVVSSEAREEGGSTSAVVRAEVPVTIFTDDLMVTIKETKTGVTVDVHSQSRVGKGDFGENRRHIIQFLRELDRQLADITDTKNR